MHNGPRGPKMDKSKDFVGSMKRLFKELKSFQILIAMALIFAILSSVLSIAAPNKLSKLTDTISEGLIVNVDEMQEISKKTTNNLQNINPQEIMKSTNLSVEEKTNFMMVMQSSDKANMLDNLAKLSDNTLELIFKEFTINNQKISSTDQLKFLQIASTIKDKKDAKALYKKIDKMPKSIRKVIEPSMNMAKIKKISLFLACLYIVSALLSFIESIIMTSVSNNFARKLRGRISTKINKLPLKYFDKNQTGDILSRVTNDVDTIAQSMNQSLSSLVSAVTLLLGTIIMMFITNWIMALTAISASIIGFSLIFIVLSKSQKYFAARQKELGKLNSHIEEVYSGLLVVKAYNGKKEADTKFDEYNEKVYDANRKSQFLSGLMQPIMSFIGNFGYVAVCIVGALLVMHDAITFGVIIAFITYVRLFTSPLMQIAQAFTSLQSTAAASERVFEFLDEEEMSLETNKTKILDKSKVKGNIEFNHVSFGYDKDRTIIKDFTASVKDGQKIAIVGPTGAGKTTMVNLLMKFYEINKGDILIDNVSINDLTRENVHSLFTMVLQDTWLFNGTVKENIVYNRENISDEMVKEVCDTVGLTHFIKTLPNGFDSVIGENDSVSAGQRQLLTIARGMIEDSPFLILDEATSNVDTRTEELVQKAMDKLTEGRTSFIIAHRLSTIKNADLILVMKDGNIIETGNHDELMKKNGFYADLYNSQFEL
ncbi:aBC superfamily ATP binding cassette transporter permease/ABC protein [Clostridium sp. CAG:451]|nr:aBC superfamily ATP binding cassette transporter permease/ABC protein [Clostridium sp. CAG:451]